MEKITTAGIDLGKAGVRAARGGRCGAGGAEEEVRTRAADANRCGFATVPDRDGRRVREPPNGHGGSQELGHTVAVDGPACVSMGRASALPAQPARGRRNPLNSQAHGAVSNFPATPASSSRRGPSCARSWNARKDSGWDARGHAEFPARAGVPGTRARFIRAAEQRSACSLRTMARDLSDTPVAQETPHGLRASSPSLSSVPALAQLGPRRERAGGRSGKIRTAP